MGRRSDIDWESIEKAYRAGIESGASICKRFGISRSSLTKKTNDNKWTRDLTAAIQARTREKISTIDVADLIEQSANESAGKSAETIKKAIEEASDAAAGVVLRHRKSFRDQFERAARIEALFDELLETAGASCPKDGEEPVAIDIAKASAAFKSLVESRAKLVEQERKSFSLETAVKPEDDRDLNSMPASEAWKIVSESLK